ncbi:hypothetical protein DL98DRAFT_441453, partial [Cadophora sp. DSE1049]
YKFVFLTILKREALNYYFNILVRREYSFEVIVQLLRGYFETLKKERSHLET